MFGNTLVHPHKSIFQPQRCIYTRLNVQTQLKSFILFTNLNFRWWNKVFGIIYCFIQITVVLTAWWAIPTAVSWDSFPFYFYLSYQNSYVSKFDLWFVYIMHFIPIPRYTVMSGTPQKMLEHLLETRLSGQVGPNDPFLDDFILTHIVFMPVQLLINELANLYPLQNDLINYYR